MTFRQGDVALNENKDVKEGESVISTSNDSVSEYEFAWLR